MTTHEEIVKEIKTMQGQILELQKGIDYLEWKLDNGDDYLQNIVDNLTESVNSLCERYGYK